MLRRKRVNSDSPDPSTPRRGGRLRNAFADAGWAVRERVFWRLGDALRAGGEIVKWPFERAAWAVRRGLVWRLEDRADSLGPGTRAAGFAGVIVLAAVAGVAGMLWAAPNHESDGGAPVAIVPVVPARPIVSAPAPEPVAKPKPTLQGTVPLFKPAENEGDKKGGSSKSANSRSDSSSSSSTTSSAKAKPLAPVLSSSGPKPGDATTSAAKQGEAAVAGPKAVEVARRFASAFVLYETGRGSAEVRRTFAETATPELRKALLRRPPRLPANVEVPKAKVLNVVPGRASGGVYPVSVSLLRVGLTSELRLDMEPGKGKQWRVTDVLG